MSVGSAVGDCVENSDCVGDGTTCVECGKVFTHAFYFSTHINTHISQKGFPVVGQCTLCGRVFSDQSLFASHMISSQNRCKSQVRAQDDDGLSSQNTKQKPQVEGRKTSFKAADNTGSREFLRNSPSSPHTNEAATESIRSVSHSQINDPSGRSSPSGPISCSKERYSKNSPPTFPLFVKNPTTKSAPSLPSSHVHETSTSSSLILSSNIQQVSTKNSLHVSSANVNEVSTKSPAPTATSSSKEALASSHKAMNSSTENESPAKRKRKAPERFEADFGPQLARTHHPNPNRAHHPHPNPSDMDPEVEAYLLSLKEMGLPVDPAAFSNSKSGKRRRRGSDTNIEEVFSPDTQTLRKPSPKFEYLDGDDDSFDEDVEVLPVSGKMTRGQRLQQRQERFSQNKEKGSARGRKKLTAKLALKTMEECGVETSVVDDDRCVGNINLPTGVEVTKEESLSTSGVSGEEHNVAPCQVHTQKKVTSHRAEPVTKTANKNVGHRSTRSPTAASKSNVARVQTASHKTRPATLGVPPRILGDMSEPQTRYSGNVNVQKSSSLEDLKRSSREDVEQMLLSVGMMAVTHSANRTKPAMPDRTGRYGNPQHISSVYSRCINQPRNLPMQPGNFLPHQEPKFSGQRGRGRHTGYKSQDTCALMNPHMSSIYPQISGSYPQMKSGTHPQMSGLYPQMSGSYQQMRGGTYPSVIPHKRGCGRGGGRGRGRGVKKGKRKHKKSSKTRNVPVPAPVTTPVQFATVSIMRSSETYARARAPNEGSASTSNEQVEVRAPHEDTACGSNEQNEAAATDKAETSLSQGQADASHNMQQGQGHTSIDGHKEKGTVTILDVDHNFRSLDIEVIKNKQTWLPAGPHTEMAGTHLNDDAEIDAASTSPTQRKPHDDDYAPEVHPSNSLQDVDTRTDENSSHEGVGTRADENSNHEDAGTRADENSSHEDVGTRADEDMKVACSDFRLDRSAEIWTCADPGMQNDEVSGQVVSPPDQDVPSFKLTGKVVSPPDQDMFSYKLTGQVVSSADQDVTSYRLTGQVVHNLPQEEHVRVTQVDSGSTRADTGVEVAGPENVRNLSETTQTQSDSSTNHVNDDAADINIHSGSEPGRCDSKVCLGDGVVLPPQVLSGGHAINDTQAPQVIYTDCATSDAWAAQPLVPGMSGDSQRREDPSNSSSSTSYSVSQTSSSETSVDALPAAPVASASEPQREASNWLDIFTEIEKTCKEMEELKE